MSLLFCYTSRALVPRQAMRLRKQNFHTQRGLGARAVHIIDGLPCQEVRITVHDASSESPSTCVEVVVLEAMQEAQEVLIQRALNETNERSFNSDPYGAVLWPSARTVSSHMIKVLTNRNFVGYSNPSTTTVLELGSGTGLVSLTCALMGCKKVVASDYSPFALSLISATRTLQSQPIQHLETLLFDVSDLSLRYQKAQN